MDDTLWTIIIASIASINCALIGTYLVLRRIAMTGDAIAHSSLPGIVLALLITGSKNSFILIVGAGITAILVTLLIAFLEKKISIQADAAIGINFTFLFALGVILISFFSRKVDLDPECSLYGELSTVSLDVWRTNSGINLGPKAFYILLTNLVLNISFIIIGYKYLFITTFDPQFSQSIGVHNTLWHYCLMGIISLTTVSAFEIAGAILVVAFLIIPAASTYLVTKCLKDLLFCNIIFSIITSISGYYISFFLNSSMASTMVIVSGLLFLFAFVFSKKN